MFSRAPTLRALLRAPSKPHPQFTRPFSRLQYRAPTPPVARPSLSVTYRAIPLHLQSAVPAAFQPSNTRSIATSPTPSPPTSPTAGAQWTHFSTAYSYSSVRTFTSSRERRLPVTAAAESSSSQATSPEAAQRIEEAIEEIGELYGTARDEFEIATEETEKNSTYAPDDREAAREELDKLLEFYKGIIEGADRAVAEEVKRRVGGRIRELEQAVLALEEAATHGD